MRKLTYAIALCTLLLAGCSQDEAIVESKGELVTLNYNVSLGNGVQSRADVEDLAVNKLACAVYEVTQAGNGATNYEWKKTEFATKTGDKTFTYTPKLFSEVDYKIVFFAYYEDNENGSCFTFDENQTLSSIRMNMEKYDTGVFVGNKYKDAFTATDEIVNGNSTKSGNISLTRPFAKITVLTSKEDMDAAEGLGDKPATCHLTITGHNDVFNALTGQWSQSATPTQAELTSEVSTATKTIDGKEYYYLAEEYFFSTGSNVTCTVVVKSEDETIIYNNSVSDMPLSSNVCTNMTNENLLTGGGVTYTITLVPGFTEGDSSIAY